MNTHKLARKWTYRTLLKKILNSPYGLHRTVRVGNKICHPETLSIAKGTQDLIDHLSTGLPPLIKDLTMTKRHELIITILCLLPLCGFLTGCGLKLPPQPPEDAVITYPRPYPNPKLEEWSIAECPPPVLEVCSPAEVCPPVEVCSPANVCGE
jgi:predicted small lipoprotein YifL